jgi:hypothetical protein
MPAMRSLLVLLVLAAFVHAQPFAIEVVDDQTGRGVPMVELQTTSAIRYYTDSAGVVAFDEPGLMNQKVHFAVSSHGYEFARDGFGIRGIVLETKPGTVAKLKIKRINIAERLYRITGSGIYADTIRLGRKPPIDQPLLNAQITGQDGILNAIYRGKLWWFYGDTIKLSYPLGNFAMAGATTELPEKIDPDVGFRLDYFLDKDGFSKSMAPMEGEGVVWLYGVVVLPDETGRERMLAFYQRRRGLEATLENGFVIYNDDKEQFEKHRVVKEIEPPIYPIGYPSRVKHEDGEYIYFTAPFPALRVKAELKSYLDLAAYEGFTCYRAGTKELERDGAGKLVWGWKKNTPPLKTKEQEDLIATGKMKPDETPMRLANVDDGKVVMLNNCSCFWNDYLKKYIMIASEHMGATTLGEVWFAAADKPHGPWTKAKKIITHANKQHDAHDFYNPTQHPFFDREGGKIIYLEGSYVNTFSGNPQPTPRYEYNQIMYRLDLADDRLKF